MRRVVASALHGLPAAAEPVVVARPLVSVQEHRALDAASPSDVQAELIDHMLIVSQRHLRAVLANYVRHYNGRRPHRACDLRPPNPTHPVADVNHERIKRRPVLGVLINEYERVA